MQIILLIKLSININTYHMFGLYDMIIPYINVKKCLKALNSNLRTKWQNDKMSKCQNRQIHNVLSDVLA